MKTTYHNGCYCFFDIDCPDRDREMGLIFYIAFSECYGYV